MESLPYAADAKSPLSPAELNVLRTQYVREGEKASIQTKFNYAWGLVKSANRNDQEEGVTLLKDIYKASPERRRECLYYLALGSYKLGAFAEARKFNDALLNVEPRNAQAQSLKSLIDEQVAKDGFIGMAIVGGIVVGASVLIGMLRSKK